MIIEDSILPVDWFRAELDEVRAHVQGQMIGSVVLLRLTPLSASRRNWKMCTYDADLPISNNHYHYQPWKRVGEFVKLIG